ncbi:unnamed protein product, partial [Amaranthus hypochondriacus]
MNIQTRVSGQISGQIPNQASNQLPGMPQQNGNTFYTPVQNLVGQSNPSVMDPEEVLKIRRFMQDRIYQTLMQKPSQSDDNVSKRSLELSKRLEEGLFKSAPTKEEYMNLSTLESRLQTIIKRSNHAPQPLQFMNSPTPVGTMIPTPGMQQQHNVNSNVMASSTVDPSNMITSSGSGMSSSIPGTGGFMPNSNGPFSDIRGGSFHGVDGSLSNGYQKSPSSFPMNSSNNNLMTGQRVMSQMIPTPGFSSNNNNQTLMNMDNSSNGGVLSCVDPSGVSQHGPQKHVGQNSRMLQNLGSAVNNGMRSSMQSRFQNGSVNSGFGNNVQLMNSSGSSDGYLTTQSFGASSRPLQQSHDSHQRPAMQGDGYRIGATDSTGSGSFYNAGSHVASLINNQGLVQMKPQSRSNSLMSQTNAQVAQSASYLRPQLTEQQQIASSHQQKQSSDQQQPFGRIDQFSQVQTTSDLGSRVKSETGIEHPSEVLQSQIPSGQLQYPDSHSHLLNANGNLSRISQSSSVPSMAHDVHSTLLQNSRQVIGDEATNEYSNVVFGVQSDALLHSQWHSEAERPSLSGNVSNEQHVQEEFCQRIVGHDKAQCNNLSSDVSNFGQTVASQSAVDQARLVGASNSSGKELLERQYRNQQRWLLFLRHARGCRAPVGKCLERTCPRVQNLLKHIDNCHSSSCPDPRCRPTKTLINHHKQCRDQKCPVCVPVYKFIHAQRLAFARKNTDSGLQRASCRSSEVSESKVKDTLKPSEVFVTPPENQPALKRLKTEPSSQPVPSESGSIFVPVNANKTSLVSQSVQ